MIRYRLFGDNFMQVICCTWGGIMIKLILLMLDLFVLSSMSRMAMWWPAKV